MSEEYHTNDVYDDFEMKGSLQALMLSEDGHKIIVSRALDTYQYRTLVRDPSSSVLWKESEAERGPLIDRTKDRLFIVIAISQMFLGETKELTPQLVLVVLKGGPTHLEVWVHVEFHNFVLPNTSSVGEGSEPQKMWRYKKSIYDHSLPIHQAPTVFNPEIMHWGHTTITDAAFGNGTAMNKVIHLFGQYFIALDWDPEMNKVLIFETYKNLLGENP